MNFIFEKIITKRLKFVIFSIFQKQIYLHGDELTSLYPYIDGTDRLSKPFLIAC